MLSTELSTIFVLAALALSLIALYISIAAVRFVRYNSSESLSLSKMAKVEASLTELTDSYDALLTSHKKLRSRIGMRKHRGNGEAKDDEPDSRTDPAAWKRWARLQLHQGTMKKR